MAEASRRAGAGAARDSLAAAHLLEAYLAGLGAADEESDDERRLVAAATPSPTPTIPAARRARGTPRANARRSAASATAKKASRRKRPPPPPPSRPQPPPSRRSRRAPPSRSSGTRTPSRRREPDAEQPRRAEAGRRAAAAEPEERRRGRRAPAAGAAATAAPTPAPEPRSSRARTRASRAAPPDDDFWGEEGDPSMTGAASRPRRRWRRPARHRSAPSRRHPFRIVGVIVLVLVVWFLFALFQPFHGDGSRPGRRSRSRRASSVSEVGDLLDEKGVDLRRLDPVPGPRHPRRQALRALRRHTSPSPKDMSYGAAIDALSTAAGQKRTTTVTIPEGYSRSQAAQLVEEDGLPGSYTKTTVKSKYLDPAEYGGKDAKNLEGFLFPDTFELKPKAPVADLVQLQLQDFKRQIKSVDMSYAKSKNLTVYDVLTSPR